MEITNALLVAMMFIVLLTMGIGNIIASLASLIDKLTPNRADLIHTSWVLLLLLIHLNLFWHVLTIFDKEDWRFAEFLYIVCGALLIYFATHVLLPGESGEKSANLRAHYFSVHRLFFSLLGILMIWSIGFDFIMGTGLTNAGIGNLAALFLLMALALNSRESIHMIGVVIAWLLFILILTARGMGIIN